MMPIDSIEKKNKSLAQAKQNMPVGIIQFEVYHTMSSVLDSREKMYGLILSKE